MNERIKELANEALLYVSDRDSPGTIEINQRLEKFAELIVKECASLFDPELTVLHEERILRESILNHFGIKE